MNNDYRSAFGWTLPPVLLQHDNPRQEVNDYVPLKDFQFFDLPVPANKEFGDYFLSLIHKNHAPVCEVAAWMHLTGEQIVHIFEGTAPAPNTEQLAVAYVLLSLNQKEKHKLTSLAVFSWYASGIDVQEQLNPSHTIFTEKKSGMVRKEESTGHADDFLLQKEDQTVKKEEIPDAKTKAISVITPATDGQIKKQKEKQVIIPPNLRMKVNVFMTELADGAMIEEITTKTGDRISIDKTESIERDSYNGFVHYRCSHGKHRIDLFKEDNAWYMDAMPLAAANTYSTTMVM